MRKERILKAEKCDIEQVDEFHFNVRSPSGKTYPVWWKGSDNLLKSFICSCRWFLSYGRDKKTKELTSPCSHILAVMMFICDKELVSKETAVWIQNLVDSVE